MRPSSRPGAWLGAMARCGPRRQAAAALAGLALVPAPAGGAQSWQLAADPLMAIGNPQVGFYMNCRGNCDYPPDPFGLGSCRECKGGKGGCAGCASPPWSMAEWMDDTIEYMQLEYENVCPSGRDGCTGLDNLNSSLRKVAKRGRQAVIHIRLARYNVHANDTKWASLPQWLMDEGVRLCQYNDGESARFQPDWNDERLITAFEKLIQQFGRFDGDDRILWIEAGLMGNDGTWRLSNQGYAGPFNCDFANEANQRRVVEAYRSNFKKTFILFPEPERMGGLDLSTAPNFGFHDWDFGASTFSGRNLTNVLDQNPVWRERWRTVPQSGHVSKYLRECWWSGDDPTAECAARGAMRDAPSYDNASAGWHAASVFSNSWVEFTPPTTVNKGVYKAGRRSTAQTEAMERIKTAYAATGPRYNLNEVTIDPVASGKLRVCAAAVNSGSARFYSPANLPMELRATASSEALPMRQAGGEGFAELAPSDGEKVFTAELKWGALDECATLGAACTAAGQTCEDPVKTVASQGDWLCVCGAPSAVKERGKPAVCKTPTYRKDDLVIFSQVKNDADVFPLKTSQELGLIDSSFTAAVRGYISLTDGKTADGRYPDVRSDPTSPSMMHNNKVTVFGVDNKISSRKAFAITVEYRAYKAKLGYKDCNPGEQDFRVWRGTIDQQWAHVTVVYDKDAQKIIMYKDGVRTFECDQIEPYIGETGQMVNVGARQRNDPGQLSKTQDKKGELFFGRLKDIVFYGDKLSDDEVMRLAKEPAALAQPPKLEISMETDFKQRDMYFATSDEKMSVPQAKTGGAAARCCGCRSCLWYYLDNRDWCDFHGELYDVGYDKECGQADCGPCGVLRFEIPPEGASPSAEGCFVPRTPAPTPVPTPAPTADTEACWELELTGFNLTVPGVTHTDPKCDGTYESIGDGHWKQLPEGYRELWRLKDNTYRCVFKDLGPDDAHFGSGDAGWWAARLTCKAFKTPMPTPAPTPLPPGQTLAPETPAPDTPAPETPAPATVAPPTPSPGTPAPPTDAPPTPAPGTPAPASPAPETFAPLTDAPTPAPTPAHPTPAPTPLPPGDTVVPSVSPMPPSAAPLSPSAAPQTPSAAPSASPSESTAGPSVSPSHPGDTSHPSASPAASPPSAAPSAAPSASPAAPSAAPQERPTASPFTAGTPSASPEVPAVTSAPSASTGGGGGPAPGGGSGGANGTGGNGTAGGGNGTAGGGTGAPAGPGAPGTPGSGGAGNDTGAPSGTPGSRYIDFQNLSPYHDDLVARGAAGEDDTAGTTSDGIPWWFWVLLALALLLLVVCVAAWVRWYRRRGAQMRRKLGNESTTWGGSSPRFSEMQRPVFTAQPDAAPPPGPEDTTGRMMSTTTAASGGRQLSTVQSFRSTPGKSASFRSPPATDASPADSPVGRGKPQAEAQVFSL
eukprot:TRINITY_DN1583_c0_g1_i1.p1 TRINITY_DN1583_c0_g1~~TRINITY_DN1583_c0_g1_i1.p1  ORF type:complete len:1419 (+),score=348.28 TRINITY_DN1583_c0_g1_i1:35-4291(+)